MNKKDIANIRKQFKLDNELLTIREIFNVYVPKESKDIFHHISQPFELLDRESQELFLVNCKKVLSGQLDSKLFKLKFKRDVDESTQSILIDGLQKESSEDWKEAMLQIVEKMFTHTIYEFDTVITFIIGQYRIPVKKDRFDFAGDENSDEYSNSFLLCSLNKTSLPKTNLVFDYIEKEFKANSTVDPVIHLTTPLSGFLFPTFQNNAADVNHILYRTEKANQLDEMFIAEVLQCENITTAAEDKDIFELIVNDVVGEKVNSEVISNMYEEIEKIVEESEEDEEETETPLLNYRDVEQILTNSGIDNVDVSKVKNAFQTIVSDEKHTFKAGNLLPKSIKINTDVANLSLSPKDLKNIKYITYNGKRCLLVEIEEDVVIEGFPLETLND